MKNPNKDSGVGVIVRNKRVFIAEIDQPFTSKESAEVHARTLERQGYDTYVQHSAFSGNWYVYIREKGR